METLILMTDIAGLLLILYFSLRNERLPEGSEEVGLFRTVRPPPPKAAPVPPQRRGRRP